MILKLKRPIVFFDLETTGTSIQHDRIVQIAVIKLSFDGKNIQREEKVVLVNPTIPIPIGATEVHGITDEMVQGKPTFKEIAKSLKEFFFGCDIGGYNSNSFDIPLLMQEFHRCQIEFPDWELNVVDSLVIERMVNSHKLEETFKRYFGKTMDGSHDAMVDTSGTLDVFYQQLKKLTEMEGFEGDEVTIESIDKFCQGDRKRFDLAGKCYEENGTVFWSFGKNVDQPVLNDRGYLNWVLNSDFPIQTKKLLKELLK